MNFLNLKYFIVAAEEMNFTKAAKRLYISQQSLSNHIAKLEESFGVQLFDRGVPLTLTEGGQSLLKNAQAMLDIKQQTELELQDIKDFRSADLTIGVPNTRGAVILPPLLMSLKKQYPQVRIHLLEGTSGEITEALYKGKVDLTLGFELDDPEHIKTIILEEEHTMIAVPENIMDEYFTKEEQAELSKYPSLPIQTFAGCPFIKMKHSNWIGAVFENSCRDGGMIPNVVVETVNIMTMVSLCAAGLGIIACPKIFLGENSPVLSKDKIKNMKLFVLEYPSAHKMIAINYLRGKYQTQAAREFIHIVKDFFHSRDVIQ